ncbi:unnamed protein product [Mytilus coruscus]|uniref:Ig-like domain-containing protein n=1 Tax=Mytilus coruscus TaxID=42192 RepID=A0A6J8BNN3_MYTCO|nr:unnamed protein product [Mytilus coruscus]
MIANETIVNAQIGKNAEVIVTIVTAVPPLKVVICSWNGKTLFGSRYINGNISTPSLSINNITALDDGTYRCFVYNEVGSTYVDIFLLTWNFTDSNKFGRSVTIFHPTLRITNLQRNDEGLYICAANHDFSEGVGEVFVSIGGVILSAFIPP